MKTTKSHIEQILRFTVYKIKFSCGHSFESFEEDACRDQLFIGKSSRAGSCLDRETDAADDSSFNMT
jgi:hypothetical protein